MQRKRTQLIGSSALNTLLIYSGVRFSAVSPPSSSVLKRASNAGKSPSSRIQSEAVTYAPPYLLPVNVADESAELILSERPCVVARTGQRKCAL